MKFWPVVILCMLFAGIISCKKGYDIPPAIPPSSFLNTINSSRDTLNYYINGTRQNNTSTIFPLGNTGYLTVSSRQNNYEFRKNGLATVVFNKSLTLKDSTYQTFFVCGETADKAFLITDTLSSSATGAKIRVVNTADGAGVLSVALNDTLIAKSYPFKQVGGYYNTVAGTKVLKVYAAGSAVVSATKTVALTTGTSYTLYLSGTPGGVGKSALAIGLFGK